jgi:hypothetical protein
VALGIDELHEERSVANHPRVRIGLSLMDDHPSGKDIEDEGEWVTGHGHRHHSFVAATRARVADTRARRTR